jgi:uncharacterized membrane protein
MMDNLALFIIFYLEIILFYYLPIFNGKGTLFGTIIKDEVFETDGKRILKNYRMGLIAFASTFFAAMLLIISYSLKSLPFLYIIFTLALSFWLFISLRKAWILRKSNIITKFAVSLKQRKLKDYTRYWLEIAVVGFTIIPFLVLSYYFQQLPDQVPVHWGFNGLPDRWEAKSFITVFAVLLIGLFVQIPMFCLKTETIKARVRVPLENAEKIFHLKEMSLFASCNLLDWIRLTVAILFANIASSILAVLANESVLIFINIWMWVTVLLLLIGSGYFVFQLRTINQEIKEITGQFTFQSQAEAESWNNEVFYYNKSDSSFMVEKPSGTGYTFNFANQKSWFYLALFFVPEFIVLIIFEVNSK